MALAGLYRRVLPSPPAFEFASPLGKQLFVEALEMGNMEGFFKLISYYQTQSEPAYCGLASLAMVLNALAIDPGRPWKGPWRWFDDSMLDCCEPLVKVKAEGISFGKLACLAHCNGASVDAFRATECTIDKFRKYVMTCTASADCHMIVSYNRATLEQTGTGHFSPVGGYHEGKDMVLILDVARFKYPPHWVPLKLLWEAIDTIDDSTGQPRGFMMISRLHKTSSILFTVSCKHRSWNDVAYYLVHNVPFLLKSKIIETVQELLSIIIDTSPSKFSEFIKWVAEVRRQEDGSAELSEEEKGRLSLKGEVLKQVRETKLSEHVADWLVDSSCCKDVTLLDDRDNLPQIAAQVCCQGAELFSGKLDVSNSVCCEEAKLEDFELNLEEHATVASTTIISDGTKQNLDMLVPSSKRNSVDCNDTRFKNCSNVHPTINDVLTVLLLVLPQHTWSCIKEEKLREEIYLLVATDNLPPLLQGEVLHLRRQLHFIMTDSGPPSPA